MADIPSNGREMPEKGRAPRPAARAPQPATLRALRQAHRLVEGQKYAQAFPMLKRLADRAADSEMPIRAASLYAQTAYARLEMGGALDAAELGRRVIQLLASAGQADRAAVLLQRLISALKDQGFHDLAISLRAEVVSLSGGTRPAPVAEQGALPSRCPSCYGPVRSDEVDWLDDRRAVCSYCGTIVRAV